MKTEFEKNVSNFLAEPFHMKEKIVKDFAKETKINIVDATFLTAPEIEIIYEKTNKNKEIETIFGTEYYDYEYFKKLSDFKNFYTIVDYDDEDNSVYLTHDEDKFYWISIIFIKEFWDFYSNYINEKNTDIEIIADNLVEYNDMIQGVITYLANINVSKENISFLIQKIISNWIRK